MSSNGMELPFLKMNNFYNFFIRMKELNEELKCLIGDLLLMISIFILFHVCIQFMENNENCMRNSNISSIFIEPLKLLFK
jgi:hypothetical protein